MLLALRAYRAELTADGFLYSETTSEAANPERYDVPNPIRFIAHGPFTDYAAKARLDAEQAYRDSFGADAKPNMNGMFYTLEKKTYGPTGEST